MADRAENPFAVKTVLALVAAGVLAFAGFLIFTAYAPQWKVRGSGGVHALSKSAVGLSGIYALTAALHEDWTTTTDDRDGWGDHGLLIVPLSVQTDSDALTALVAARSRREGDPVTTLFILPKWATAPYPGKAGWVSGGEPYPPEGLKRMLAPIGPLQLVSGTSTSGPLTSSDGAIRFAAPKALRGLTGAVPVITDARGTVILGRVSRQTYVLADPDLLNNMGMKSRTNGASALALVERLRPDDESPIAFEMVLSSGGQQRNLLRLMFEPPFLAFTLALLAAGGLIGWHAVNRFGAPLAEARAIPFGKRALADNAAVLIARAGRERALGERYVAVVRDAARTALGAGTMDDPELERWLATLPGDFATHAAAARNAPDAAAMRDAAAALHAWKKDVLRDH
ncbi:MAG: hypothetical protein ACKVOP_07395 [Sphingomonadaceae bacterium]